MSVTSNTEKGENIVAFTWTVESVKEHFTKVVAEVDRRYEERFIAQEKALNTALIAAEKAIAAALIAQEKAVNTAFTASEKAVNAALVSQEKAVSAALIAQKEAVTKAEASAEKRFESVNEFRKTLADQTATFIPRAEAIQRADNNAEKIAAVDKRMTDNFAQVNSRLDLTTGKSDGRHDFWGYVIGAVGLASAIAVLMANYMKQG